MKNLVRAAWPPAIAVLGAVPIVAARASANSGNPSGPPETSVAIVAVAVALLVAAWVRYRDDIHEWWKASMAEANEQKAAREKARKPAKASAPDESDADEGWTRKTTGMRTTMSRSGMRKRTKKLRGMTRTTTRTRHD